MDCSSCRRERAFTLTEVLITVAIIAILAAVALPQYLRVTERARAGEAFETLAALRNAQRRFKVELEADGKAGVYDATLAQIDLTPPAMQDWNPPVFQAAEVDLSVARKAGVHTAKQVRIDLNSGIVCCPDAAAAADWGIPTVAADCP